jgi:hypothetical protein
MDLLYWILKYKGGGGQNSNFEPYNQAVKVGEGWVYLEPEAVFLVLCDPSMNEL